MAMKNRFQQKGTKGTKKNPASFPLLASVKKSGVWILFSLCILHSQLSTASSVFFHFQDGRGNPIAATECIMTPVGAPFRGPSLTTAATWNFTTDGNGDWTEPNLQAGIYQGDLNPPHDTYFEVISPGDTNSYDFLNLLTNISTLPQGILFSVTNVSGGSNYLTITTNGALVSWQFTYNNASGSSSGTNTWAIFTNSGDVRAGGNLFAAGAVSAGTSLLGGTLNVTNNAGIGGALTVGSIAGDGSGLTNESGGFIGTTNGPSSTNRLGVSGLVSAMAGATPYAEIPYPGVPLYYSTWPAHGFGAEQAGTALFTVITNEFLAGNPGAVPQYAPQMLTQRGPMVVDIDAGWETPTRNASTGLLVWNLTNMLISPQLVAAWCLSNNILPILYVQDTASVSIPQTIGTNIFLDAQTIAGWGFYGVKYDTTCLNCLLNMETAFRQAVNGAHLCYFDSDFQLLGTLYPSLGSNIDNSATTGAFSGTIFCPNGDLQAPDTNTGYTNIVSYVLNVMQYPLMNRNNLWIAPREVPNNDAGLLGPTAIKLYAELKCPLGFTACCTATTAQQNVLTNQEVYDIDEDTWRIMGQPIQNIGSTNTYLILNSALSGGDYSMAFWNISINTTNTITLQWTNWGRNPLEAFTVRDVWNHTNWPGAVTGSLSIPVGPQDCYLLRFHPWKYDALLNGAQISSPMTNDFVGVSPGNFLPGVTAYTPDNSLPAEFLIDPGQALGGPDSFQILAGWNGSNTLVIRDAQANGDIAFSVNRTTQVLSLGQAISGPNYAVGGNFSGATNLNASSLASGTVPLPRLDASVITNGDTASVGVNTNWSVAKTNFVNYEFVSNTVTAAGIVLDPGGNAAATIADGYGSQMSDTAAGNWTISAGGQLNLAGGNNVVNINAGSSLNGSGSGLTGLNASQLLSGTVPLTQIGSGTPTSSNFLSGTGAGGTWSYNAVGLTNVPGPTGPYPITFITTNHTNFSYESLVVVTNTVSGVITNVLPTGMTAGKMFTIENHGTGTVLVTNGAGGAITLPGLGTNNTVTLTAWAGTNNLITVFSDGTTNF
jgi:hypothetical protein